MCEADLTYENNMASIQVYIIITEHVFLFSSMLCMYP